MAKSDYLSWDTDLDLDALLGEYTDDAIDDNSSDDPYEDLVKENVVNILSTFYLCPICSKKLKTIAGFRGHTTKQHDQSKLKASDHKYTDNKKDESPVTIATSPSLSSDFTKESFPGMFKAAFINTLGNIEKDPFVCDFMDEDEKDTFNKLLLCARSSEIIREYFQRTLECIFLDKMHNITIVSDREEIFCKLHKIRIDTSVRQQLYGLFNEALGTHVQEPIDSPTVNNFTQLIFLDIVGEVLQQQHLHSSNESESRHSDEITDTDRNILYYIGGYIVRSLSKRLYKLKKDSKREVLRAIVHSLECSEQEDNPVIQCQQYDKWYQIQNRGNLKKPCANFFLMIQEMEIIVRKKNRRQAFCQLTAVRSIKRDDHGILHDKELYNKTVQQCFLHR